MSKTVFLSILKVVCFVSGQNCVSPEIRTITIKYVQRTPPNSISKLFHFYFLKNNVKFNIRETENR